MALAPTATLTISAQLRFNYGRWIDRYLGAVLILGTWIFALSTTRRTPAIVFFFFMDAAPPEFSPFPLPAALPISRHEPILCRRGGHLFECAHTRRRPTRQNRGRERVRAADDFGRGNIASEQTTHCALEQVTTPEIGRAHV